MTLYFLDSDCKEHEIGPVSLVEGELASESVYGLIKEDLKTRKPDFTSHYYRMWWDDHGRFWVDFGSHTEFYIAHGDGNGLYSEKVKTDGSVCPQ